MPQKRFNLQHAQKGKAAEGIEFSDGFTVLRWLEAGRPPAPAFYDSFERMHALANPNGQYQVAWVDIPQGETRAYAFTEYEQKLLKAVEELSARFTAWPGMLPVHAGMVFTALAQLQMAVHSRVVLRAEGVE